MEYFNVYIEDYYNDNKFILTIKSSDTIKHLLLFVMFKSINKNQNNTNLKCNNIKKYLFHSILRA